MAKKMVDKNSKAYLQSRIDNGRHSLMLIMIFTVVNLAMVLLDSATYFLFSASVPYYMTLFFKGIDNNFVDGAWDVNGTYTMTALAVSAVILILFLLFWLLSKKRGGWLAAALVLFILDSIALVWISFSLLEDPASNIVDFVFHIWVIWELIQAVIANGKLKKMPQEGYSNLDASYNGPEIR